MGEVLNCCLGVGHYVAHAQCRLPQLLIYSESTVVRLLSSLGESRVLLLLDRKVTPSQTWGKFKVCSPMDL